MAKFGKSAAELKQELEEQLLALRSSCENYDKGNLWEAKRIAGVISILLFDGGKNSKSLLGQMSLKNDLLLISSATVFPEDEDTILVSFTANRLTVIEMGSGIAGYVPKCSLPPDPLNFNRWLKFEDWWIEIVFGGPNGNSLDRKTVIQTLRDQDGGAHVDEGNTNQDYYSAKLKGDRSWQFVVHDGSSGQEIVKPISNAIFATARQIGWEVDQSLKARGL
jgi:hypothetical protein